MRRLFKFKYPKLLLLVVFSFLSYYLFSNSSVKSLVLGLEDLSYLGLFVAGLLFSFGFTTPFAIGFFITIKPESFLMAAIIGGFGALISDLIIFKLIRFSFMDEFRRLERTKPFKSISHSLSVKPLSKIKIYLLYFFAGIIISSPLPDELGVTMLAGLTKIRTNVLAIISFFMNTLGIFVMLLLGVVI